MGSPLVQEPRSQDNDNLSTPQHSSTFVFMQMIIWYISRIFITFMNENVVSPAPGTKKVLFLRSISVLVKSDMNLHVLSVGGSSVKREKFK